MLTRLGDHFSSATSPSAPSSRTEGLALDSADMTNRKPIFPPHWVVRQGDRWLFDPYRGTTVAAPFPLAWNTCMKQEAIDVAERLNSCQAPEVEPWQVEPLDMAALLVEHHDADTGFVPAQEAA